jgi:hypothetical protein
MAVALLAGCNAPLTRPAAKATGGQKSAATAGVQILRAAQEQTLPESARQDSPVIALPKVETRAIVNANGSATLNGTVAFSFVTDTFYENSAAQRRVLSMPAGRALLTLSNLEEELLGKNGTVVSGATDTTGAFSIAGQVPLDRAYVVNANVAKGHRLSAIALAGQTNLDIDEATTAVAEMARWQMKTDATVADHRKSLADLTADSLLMLVSATRGLFTADDFKAPEGQQDLTNLKAGNGVTLRNQYVKAFGGAISAAGTAAADQLSDAWKTLLGYRPLAVRVLPTPGYSLLSASDVVGDHNGNLYMASTNLKFFAKNARGPLWQTTTSMQAGKIYPIAGGSGGSETFLDTYTPTETASVANPSVAPLVASGAPMPSIQKMVLERVGTTDDSHLFFTSRGNHRVMLIPAADMTRFGRTFKAGRLYTVAGSGSYEKWGSVIQQDDPDTPIDEESKQYLTGDDGPAYEAPIVFPQGLSSDSRGNLYVSDSGYFGVPLYTKDPAATEHTPFEHPDAKPGMWMNTYHKSVRFVRASDGKIFTLKLTKGGLPHSVSAQDVKFQASSAGNHLYVTDTFRNAIFRIKLPDNLADLDTAMPASFEIETVLGTSEKEGYINTALPGAKYPDLTNVGVGVPRANVLLSFPLAIDFDAAGNMLAGDYYRIHLIKAADLASGGGQVYPLCGAFSTGYVEGDSRLVSVRPRYLHVVPGTGNAVFVDFFRNRMMELWTARGSI